MKFSSDTLQGHPNPAQARLSRRAIGLCWPQTQNHWSSGLPLSLKPVSSLLAGASDGLAPLCSYLHGCDRGADWPRQAPPRLPAWLSPPCRQRSSRPRPPERSGRAAGAGRGWGPAGGGGGAGCCPPQLAGRGAGTGLWQAGERPGLNLQVEVSQVVDKRAGKPGAGSPGMGEDVLGSHDGIVPLVSRSCTLTRGEGRIPADRKRRCWGKPGAASSVSSCLSCSSAWLPSTQGASSQGPPHPGSFPVLRILQRIGYASVKSGVEPWCVYFRAYLHYHPCSIVKDRA